MLQTRLATSFAGALLKQTLASSIPTWACCSNPTMRLNARSLHSGMNMPLQAQLAYGQQCMPDRKVYLQWGAAAALQSCRYFPPAELQGKCPPPAPAAQPDLTCYNRCCVVILSGREKAESAAVKKLVPQLCCDSKQKQAWAHQFLLLWQLV